MIELPSDISDKMWWSMCDFHMSPPEPLKHADLSKPFVYERRWGVFYVPMGMHQGAMSLLLAFAHGFDDGIDCAKHLCLDYSEETADHWIETRPGAAFRSSVGKVIQIGSESNITIAERRAFNSFGGFSAINK